jgi:hypothetical protein
MKLLNIIFIGFIMYLTSCKEKEVFYIYSENHENPIYSTQSKEDAFAFYDEHIQFQHLWIKN